MRSQLDIIKQHQDRVRELEDENYKLRLAGIGVSEGLRAVIEKAAEDRRQLVRTLEVLHNNVEQLEQDIETLMQGYGYHEEVLEADPKNFDTRPVVCVAYTIAAQSDTGEKNCNEVRGHL